MKGIRTTTNNPRLPQDMLTMVKALRQKDNETYNISLSVWSFSEGKVEVEYDLWDGKVMHTFKTWRGLVRYVEGRVK